MKSKYLILKGCAGIGNRLFTICAAIAYAKRTKRILYVDWSDGQFDHRGINAFSKYFNLIDIDNITSLTHIDDLHNLSIYPESWLGILDKGIYDCFEFDGNVNFPLFIKNIFFRLSLNGSLSKGFGFWKPKNLNNESKNIWSSFLPIWNASCFPAGSFYKDALHEDVVVFADYAPPFSPELFKKHVKLKADIQKKVNAYADKFKLSENAVGVHVRATDKKPSSELNSIFRKIESLPLVNPAIFLATDNVDVAKLFSSKFDNVVTFAHDLPDVPAGMGLHHMGFKTGNGELSSKILKQSLLDMWLLASCEYLLYQGNSTFSVIANCLHDNNSKSFDWQAV